MFPWGWFLGFEKEVNKNQFLSFPMFDFKTSEMMDRQFVCIVRNSPDLINVH